MLKKIVGYSNIYIPSRNLSPDKGYNIYLNKKHDKWEKEKREAISSNFCFVIIKNKNEQAFDLSQQSLSRFAPETSVIVVEQNKSKDILTALNAQNQRHDWIIVLRAGDQIFPWTTARISEKLKSITREKAILFDHDQKQEEQHINPYLKPYFNKRYLLEHDIIQNALCIHRDEFQSILNEHESVFDSLYAWLLNQAVSDFHHIQEPLVSLAPNYQANYLKLINAHGIAEEATQKDNVVLRNIRFKIDETEKVSIIIPFRDKPDLLSTCVNSILNLTRYSNYEIILADNNSEEEATLHFLKELESGHDRIKHVSIDHEFNFSLINNEAAKASSGELLLFLNNDTEVLNEGWLQQLVSEIQQDKIGAVGPLLLYDDLTVQHAGVVPGIGHVAGHVFRNFSRDDKVAMHRLQVSQEVAAVTAACLLTKKDLFLSLGGFDQDALKIAYNDVDYCLKVLKSGNKLIYTPHVALKHYESKSRKFDLSKKYLHPTNSITQPFLDQEKTTVMNID